MKAGPLAAFGLLLRALADRVAVGRRPRQREHVEIELLARVVSRSWPRRDPKQCQGERRRGNNRGAALQSYTRKLVTA
jgi:hypothetical protein